MGLFSSKSTNDDSVVTYEQRNGRHAMTVVTKEEKAALQRMGRVVEDHGQPGKKR